MDVKLGICVDFYVRIRNMDPNLLYTEVKATIHAKADQS